MKKIFGSLGAIGLIFLVSFQLSAQNITIKWGNEFKGNRRSLVTAVIGRDETGTYVESTHLRISFFGRSHRTIDLDDVTLDKLDNNNNLVYSKRLVAKSPDGESLNYEGMMMVDGKIMLFTSRYNKRTDKNIAYACTVSGADGTVQGNITQVDEIEATKKKNDGAFSFMQSSDSSEILVYHDEPYEKNEEDRFSLKIYDNSLKMLWNKDVSVPYRDKDFTISGYTLSNDDKVYMLAKIQEGNREKKHGLPNYRYTILSYSEDSKTPKEYVMSLGAKFISDIQFQLNNNNDLVCSGFCSKNNSEDVSGVFYMTIDSRTGKVMHSSIKEFDMETLGQFMSKRKARKQRELKAYELRQLIPREDGGSVLLGEQFYIEVVTTSDGKGHTTTTYYYHYNDILAVGITPAGEIDWVTRVPKKQVSANDGGFYSSFATCVYKDKVFIVYNDHKKNKDRFDPDKMKTMSNPRKAMAMIVSIDSKGRYEKIPLFNNKEKGTILKPKLNLQISDNELVMYGVKGRKYMFGTAKFD
jgi:hypothetical protein